MKKSITSMRKYIDTTHTKNKKVTHTIFFIKMLQINVFHHFSLSIPTCT